MRYALALVCGIVVLLSLVSLNAAPGNARNGWQPRGVALESQVGELHAENAALQSQVEELATQLDALAMHLDDHAADPDAHHSPPDLTDIEGDVDDLEDLLMHFSRDGDDVFIEVFQYVLVMTFVIVIVKSNYSFVLMNEGKCIFNPLRIMF